jgi:hypothetical protein
MEGRRVSGAAAVMAVGAVVGVLGCLGDRVALPSASKTGTNGPAVRTRRELVELFLFSFEFGLGLGIVRLSPATFVLGRHGGDPAALVVFAPG